MALPESEQTKAQNLGWWNRFGGTVNDLFGWHRHSAEMKSQIGSGGAEGKNPYVTSWCGWGGSGVDAYTLWPGTFATYRAMEADPALAIAKAAIVLAILAAESYVEIDEDLADDATAQRGKEIIETEVLNRRSTVLRQMLEAVFVGFQAFEIVYGVKVAKDGSSYTGVAKIKPLACEMTSALIDDKGNFAGARNGQTELKGPKLLWIVYDSRNGNPYGRGRYENARRPWSNTKFLEDRKIQLVRLGTGIIVKIGYPPDSEQDKAAGRFPNRDAAIAIARSLSDGNNAVFENLVGLDPQQIINDPALAGKSNVSIETIDLGDPGPRLSAIGNEQDRLAKDLVRALLLPERTVQEATMAGSRADSESHGDIASADAEATHELIVDQANEQLVDPLIRENCGERYVGRIRWVASPLQDEQRRQYDKMWAALLTDPQIRASVVDSIGDDGLQRLMDRLGLGLTLLQPIDPLRAPEKTADDAPSQPNPDADDEQN